MRSRKARRNVWLDVAVLYAAMVGLLWLQRELGFASGHMIGLSLETGLGLVLLIRYGLPGCLLAAAAHLAAHFMAEIPWELALADAWIHAIALYCAASVMRLLRHYKSTETQRGKWEHFFFGGICVYTVAMVVGQTALLLSGLATFERELVAELLMVVQVEPLGFMLSSGFIISLPFLRSVSSLPLNLVLAAGLAALSVGSVWLLTMSPLNEGFRSTILVLLAIPLSIWLAMSPNSLGASTIAMISIPSALWLILRDAGSIYSAEFGMTSLAYIVLTISYQLVHCLNIDRMNALQIAEGHKANLERRVAQRTAKLAAMTERAISADKAKTQFLATISHELRTPLNGVIGMAGVLLMEEHEAKTRKNIEMIRSSGVHLLDLIDRLLDFSKLEYSQQARESAFYDLRDLVEEVISEARFNRHADGLVVEFRIDPALPETAHGDRQGLRQVLTNLIGNAVKFTEKGSVILEVAKNADGKARFSIADTGIGIASDALERIFQPFQQADGSMTRRYGGTGLGLTISMEIVASWGGAIEVESTPGEGSTFAFDIDLTEQIGREEQIPEIDEEIALALTSAVRPSSS